jgi:hypothetical protein
LPASFCPIFFPLPFPVSGVRVPPLFDSSPCRQWWADGQCSALVEVSAPVSLDFFPLADPPMATLLLGFFLPNFVSFLYVFLEVRGTASIRFFCFCLILFLD